MQKGSPVDIPLTVDLHVNEFSAGVVVQKESGTVNIVFDQFQDGRWYATQRPGINQLEDASIEVSDERGRGAYYWDAVSDKYICNADTVYKTSYSGSTMSISDGTQRVFMYEIGSYLVVIDQENDEGWTIISSGGAATIAAITDVSFPPKQTPALPICRGGAVLNGKLYVMTTGGDIYESAIEDPTSWAALSFRNAEVEPDAGIYLAKHHEHLVAFGSRSIEFFQDAGNPTGSTLNARTDISYDIGAIDADTVATVGDRLYFVGQDKSGGVGVWMLDNFSLVKVSGEDVDSLLTSAVAVDDMGLIGSGFVSGGRDFYMLTPYNTITDIVPVATIAYVGTRQWWGHWDVQLPDVDYFPLVSWIPSPISKAGEGILVNGDLVTVTDDFNPQDVVSASSVYVDAPAGPYVQGVYSATGGSGTNIPFEIITGDFNGNSPRIKRQGDLWMMHMPLTVDENVAIAYLDDEDLDYDTGRDLSVKDKDARLNRGGAFRRRNYKVTGSLSKQIRMEGIRTTVGIG